MRIRRQTLATPFCLTLALAGTAAALLLAGCGAGIADTSISPLLTPAFSGKAMGGPNPIVGATIKIYATGDSTGASTNYGVGTMLQEADQKGASPGQDTDATGSFTFSTPYNCPAGQFAYLVASGGNTGGNTVNNNAVLVSALGRCEDLYNNLGGGVYNGYKGSDVYINEVTTIAAAYALGHFSSVANSGAGASTTVGIGSDASNNAAQIAGVSTGCVAGVGACTLTATAGLAHAFLNAANLANVFTSGGPFTGANATLPGNSAAVVPQQLIDTLGNILVSCVNSNGGTTGDGSVCGSIFAATTIGASVPADTFTAMVNLAANPTLSGSTVAAQSLYALIVPNSAYYQPSLASKTGLNDWSIGISYPATMGAAPTNATSACATPPCMGLTYPISGALDINDVYYVGNQTGSSGAAGLNLFAFSSNGTILSTTTNGVTMKYTLGLSVDALGRGYFGNGSGSGTSAVGVFSTGGGQLSQYTIVSAGGAKIYQTAVDRANYVWVLGTATTGSTLLSSPAGAASLAGQASFTVAVPSGPGNIGLAIDANQNIWTANTATINVLQNTGTVAVPTYSSASALSTTAGGGSVIGIAFTPGAAYVSSYSTGPGVQPFAPVYTGAEITSLGAGTNSTVNSKITGSIFNEADGGGTIWLADTNSHSVIAFTPDSNPANDTAYRYEPCAYQSATQGCFTGTSTQASLFTTGKPYEVGIDSTGSIWVTGPAAGSLIQIIGAAAPTWPLLSLGLTGTP